MKTNSAGVVTFMVTPTKKRCFGIEAPLGNERGKTAPQ
jgi:hypothetical protein